MLVNNVRELRARFRWLQQDVADAIGATRQTVGLIEKGVYSPSITLALKIAAAFKLPAEEVFLYKMLKRIMCSPLLSNRCFPAPSQILFKNKRISTERRSN